MYFTLAVLARLPLRAANRELQQLLCAHAGLLAGLEENQLLNRLRYQINLRLGQQCCDLATCAQAMDLPAAVLQRALAQQGQGFRRVREELQRLRSRERLLAGDRYARWHAPAALRRIRSPFTGRSPLVRANPGAISSAALGMTWKRVLRLARCWASELRR